MPIYEYICQKCEKVSEVFQKVSDPHPEQCPRCQQFGFLRKLISQTSFSLKGEGWYVTDYKSGKSAPSKDGSTVSGDASSEVPATSTDGATGEAVKDPVSPPKVVEGTASTDSKE